MAPRVMEMKARDVRLSGIEQLLEPIWERGAVSHATKVCSLLRAAITLALNSENRIGRGHRRRCH
jgi:hypothetical protein